MVELNYRKEKDGLLYPMLETGSQQAEGLETLGRYAKLAQEYLLEKEESRYSLLLRTGKLPELLFGGQAVRELHPAFAGHSDAVGTGA